MRPVVLVTTDRRFEAPWGDRPEPRPERPFRPEIFLTFDYFDAVERAGGLPVLLPPQSLLADDELDRLLAGIGALLITGGAADIHPRHYGARLEHPLVTDEPRAETEIRLATAALARGIPILGVCGGLQVMVVAAGGTLHQHLPSDLPGSLPHSQPLPPVRPGHEVAIDPASRLAATVGPDPLWVNSTHHQAANRTERLRVVATAPDGVVEAVELPDHPFAIGVQWHPEVLRKDGDPKAPREPRHQLLFDALVRASASRSGTP